MMKLAMMKLRALALVLAGRCCCHRQTPLKQRRPNIVFFLSDDQPLRAMSHRDPWFHTPNLDLLAEKGIVFENGFVDCSVCCVSRASIMTGQHNIRHGIQSFDDPLSPEQMEQSFPVLLRKAGYRTALLGKYAIGHPRAAPKDCVCRRISSTSGTDFCRAPATRRWLTAKSAI